MGSKCGRCWTRWQRSAEGARAGPATASPHATPKTRTGSLRPRRVSGGLGRFPVPAEKTEHHEESITDELVDESAAFAHPVRHHGEERVQSADHFVRWAVLGESGEPAHVAEEHRRVAQLTPQAQA